MNRFESFWARGSGGGNSAQVFWDTLVPADAILAILPPDFDEVKTVSLLVLRRFSLSSSRQNRVVKLPKSKSEKLTKKKEIIMTAGYVKIQLIMTAGYYTV